MNAITNSEHSGAGMLKKITDAMGVYGLMLPAQIKAALMDLGAEMDRLRAEVNELRSKINS